MSETKDTKDVKKSGGGHIRLTSHPTELSHTIKWGAKDPKERGPIIATLTDPAHRNVIGTHSGSYAIYRALAVTAGHLRRSTAPT